MKTKDTIKLELEVKNAGFYDVVVCGGGTSGVVAALAAARNGAKTVLIEDSGTLGGMLTTGNAGITKSVMHGIDLDEQKKINSELLTHPENVQVAGGIPMEMMNELVKSGRALGNNGTAASYVFPDVFSFKLYLFEKLQEADVKIMLHSRIFDVIKEGERIVGVTCHTKEGALAIYGKTFVDATGDGDVAAFSGVPFRVGASKVDEVVKEGLLEEGSLHEPGSMYRIGGVDFKRLLEFLKENPDRFYAHRYGMMSLQEFEECFEKGEAIETFCELKIAKDGKLYRHFQIYNNPREGVMVGCISVPHRLSGLKVDEYTQAEYEALSMATTQLSAIKEEYPGFEKAYILDVPMGIRETRHIDGEYMLTIRDILTNEPFDDTIGLSSHPVDVAPRPKCCQDAVPPKRAWFRIPYRSLVAKNVDNLLVAGRCISATREAYGCIRPTVACMVCGEAAGTAAAMLCNTDYAKARDIDVKKLQKQLKNQGVVLEMK